MFPMFKYYVLCAGEFLLSIRMVRWLFSCCCILFSSFISRMGDNYFYGLKIILKCQKIISIFPADISNSLVNSVVLKLINRFAKGEQNLLTDYYINSAAAKKYREEFRGYGCNYAIRLKYPKKNDYPERQGDLIILKPYMGTNEKGVLLIKYNDSFEKFLAIYDLDKLSSYYRIVLEPSTWGYQDIIYCLFHNLGTDIVVQAQNAKDFDYIKSLNCNLMPIRIGAGDWVDPNMFNKSNGVKKYDIIMIASWQLLKRHRLLFKALSKIKDTISKVCLIGYPSEGRDKLDIINDAKKNGVLHLLEINECIPHKEVAEKNQQSRVTVMLSKREGANKALYETLFCDVPVVLYAENKGVNLDIINDHTGIISSDAELHNNLLWMIKNYKKFTPRNWALKNTGYQIATAKLNSFIKNIAKTQGENWTQDIFTKKNSPNALYIFKHERLSADKYFLSFEKYLKKAI